MSSVTHKAARLTYGLCRGGLQAAPTNIVMLRGAKHRSESQIKMFLSYFQTWIPARGVDCFAVHAMTNGLINMR